MVRVLWKLNQCFRDTRSGTTSPSTREAIAGMLSISVSAMSHLSETKSSNYELSDDYGENIDKVHQDEDYSK